MFITMEFLSLIYSLNKFLLSTFCVPVLGMYLQTTSLLSWNNPVQEPEY